MQKKAQNNASKKYKERNCRAKMRDKKCKKIQAKFSNLARVKSSHAF